MQLAQLKKDATNKNTETQRGLSMCICLWHDVCTLEQLLWECCKWDAIVERSILLIEQY